MSDEPFHPRAPRASGLKVTKRAGKPSKPDPSGWSTTGRIVRIVRGQGHAFTWFITVMHNMDLPASP